MGDVLKRPYEISIWEDILVEEEERTYYKEVKIAIIGSDTMTNPGRAINPVFNKKVNGEITLTFDIVHKYYDDLSNGYIINPFQKYLINERKVKLWYDDEWYDFIIKTCEETSDSNTFNYTATGLFVNELGKVGYNIVLSNDLRNNQGTIFELGEKAVKGTDWVIDKENSDIIQQFVAEPLYNYTINSALTVKDLLGKEEVTLQPNEKLYLFYSSIANKQEQNVFFMRKADYDQKTTTTDDNNVIRLPNYSFLSDASYNEDGTVITIGEATLTRIVSEDNPTGINSKFQGYRLAYNQQIGYDTVKDRPVTLYEAIYEDGSKKTIYKYTDYEYVTSDVVTNFVTNGESFNVYTNGDLEGWSAATPNEKVAFSRSLSELKIEDDLGVTFKISDVSKIFSDLHIKLAEYVETTETIPSFDYYIWTENSNYIRFTYNWGTAATERLIVAIKNDDSEVIYEFTPESVGRSFSIADIGNITKIETVPQSELVREAYEEVFEDKVVFTTSQEKGKYIPQPLELVTYPNITAKSILDLARLNGVRGYLRTQFRGVGNKENGYSNSVFNSGIGDAREQIQSFSKGEEYVFRISYGLTNEDGGQPLLNSDQGGKIKAIVAKYETKPQTIYNKEEKTDEQVYLYTPDVNNILFEFDGPFVLENNKVTGGYFRINDTGEYVAYYKDGVSVTPSVNSCYVEEIEEGRDIEKVWDTSTATFIDKDNRFLDYYYTTAVCQKAISNTILADTADDYGIFLYIDDENYIATEQKPNYFCINEVQLFKKKLDGEGDIVLIGNIPKATSISTYFFYLQPQEDTEEEDIETYSSAEAIAESLGLTENEIKPVYNEDFEKISSIEASQSNCFNIIQDLCEAFECWAKFEVDHEENGAIRLDSEGAPSKKITFHVYSGKDNFAGFKYGINLESIQRTLESDEFVSKLIVEQVQNDAVEGGTVSIAAAPSNPSGESYILNMSYYLNQGLIENPQQYYKDYTSFIEQLKNINAQYNYNKAQLQLAIIARTKANANVNVYHELVEEAQHKVTDYLFQFKDVTGIDYSDYTMGNGYSIAIAFREEGGVKKLYGTFSNLMYQVEPIFYSIEGNIILVKATNEQKGLETTTVEYVISEENSEEYTIDDIKYVGIEEEIENFEIPQYDGSYSSYLTTFDTLLPPHIISQFTKYIWEINHSKEEEVYYHPTLESDRLNRTINIIPSSEHETLTEIVGQIYTSQQVINDYTPLLEMSKTEKADLDLLIDGTKNYVLTVSTTSKVVGQVEYNMTKEILDDYVSGLSFSLSNENGTYDVSTSPTEKAFSQDALYTTIVFRQYPPNYQLKYILNGKEVITQDPAIISLPQKGSKSFTLIPINEQKGIKDVMEELLDEKDEVEAKFYKKYSRYIQEGTWTSDDYIDNELYYLDALNVSKVSAQPKVSYNLSVQEISELPGFENYIFDAGDKSYIEDTQFFGYKHDINEYVDLFEVKDKTIILPENTVDVLKVYRDLDHYMHFGYDYGSNTVTILDDVDDEALYVRYSWDLLTPIREEVVVSEVEWHLDDASENTITIQNYKTQFDDLFQRMAAAVQSVEYNSASYSRAASLLDEGGFINAGILLKSLNELAGGFSLSGDNTITAAEDGIIVKDLLDPMRQMKIAGAGLKTSVDGGYNWNTVITAEGLTIDTIDTQNVLIKDGDNPSFRWDKYGLNAYGFDSNKTDLKTYIRFDKYGLYGVKNGENFQAQSLKDIKDTAQFGLLWDGFFIKNSYVDGYVSISSDNDFQVVANDQERIKIGALGKNQDGYEYGIRIKNANGENVFVTDDSGDIEMTGVINAKGGTFTDSISVGSEENGIILQGNAEEAIIGSSSYFSDTSKGWAIRSNGDAIFNNITARGAIKTAVFEYEEIEAVGGIFIFRPSSTIKTAEVPQSTEYEYRKVVPDGGSPEDYHIEEDADYYELINGEYVFVEDPVEENISDYYVVDEENVVFGDDLLLTVENPLLFSVGDWCKVSNYTPDNPTSSLANNGLVNVFEVTDISNNILTLANGASMFEDVINPTTVIDDDKVRAIGENNIYTLTDITDPLNIHNMDNLTGKYNYDILIVEDNESESGDEDTDDNENSFAEGTPKTVIFTNGNNTYPVTYLGNLYLWSDNEEDNTGETYLFITINNNTSLYIGEDNDYYSSSGERKTINFLIQKTFEISYEVESLVGGALISFGNYPSSIPRPISQNYGIGINSSDSSVQLPARAISLFETEISPNEDIKVGYKFRGILGTLPELPATSVNTNIYDNMRGTQGIYTDNMYLGDLQQYLAFYTDRETGERKLKISAAELSFEIPDEHGQGSGHYQNVADIEAEGVPGPPGDDAVNVVIESNIGNFILKTDVTATLSCKVYSGTRDITNEVSTFTWIKRNQDGEIDPDWVPTLASLDGQSILVDATDIIAKAIFTCTVEF